MWYRRGRRFGRLKQVKGRANFLRLYFLDNHKHYAFNGCLFVPFNTQTT